MIRHREKTADVTLRTPPSYLWLKSCIDGYLALVALLLAGPLMLVLALRIRRDSPGPALFRQTRAGQDGRPFQFYKFRTMRADTDPFGDSPEAGDDPRLTRIGRWLRESSLDELPQLLNVLRGEMSLVGPRPLFVPQIAEWSPRHRARLLVKPGLTGLAQISGRASITLEEKLELDVQYVQHVSLRTDVAIIWETLGNVFGRRGLYQTQYSQRRRRYAQPSASGG